MRCRDGTLWSAASASAGGKSVANTNWNSGVRLDVRINDDHELWLDYDVSRQKFDNSEGQTGTLDSLASLWRVGNAVIPNPNGSGTSPAARCSRAWATPPTSATNATSCR
jgi:outer membrane receptor for ferrienterochelin and colicins